MNVPKLQIKLFLGTQSGLPVDRLFPKKIECAEQIKLIEIGFLVYFHPVDLIRLFVPSTLRNSLSKESVRLGSKNCQ